MATQNIEVDDTGWTDITSAASLQTDTVYFVQTTGPKPIYLFENSTSPAATATGVILGVGPIGYQFKQSSDNLYARSENSVSKLTITESY